VQRGIPNAENVAAHSFGVVYTAVILCHFITGEKLNREKILLMAILHDLPEGLTTDIPTPAWRYLPANVKEFVERGAMNEILGDVLFASEFMALWEEMNKGETAESKLVHDADKLEMFIQALMYEKQFGNVQLAEFWQRPHTFYFAECQAIYEDLRARR
jgi:putative hydrolase of HD superfamily